MRSQYYAFITEVSSLEHISCAPLHLEFLIYTILLHIIFSKYKIVFITRVTYDERVALDGSL